MTDVPAPAGMRYDEAVVTSRMLRALDACPASRVYRLEKKDKPGMGMFWGIILHKFIETGAENGEHEAVRYIQTKKWKPLKAMCLRIDLSAFPSGWHEAGYAHNPFDGNAERKFGAFAHRHLDGACEQWGCADLVAFPDQMTPRWMVADYKSYNIPEPPLYSTQLLGLGASVMRDVGATAVDVAHARIHGSGCVSWRIQTLTLGTVQLYETWARSVHVKVMQSRMYAQRGELPLFVPGLYCFYCRLRTGCSAVRRE